MAGLKKLAVLMMIFASVFMTGCDASKIMETITKVADGIKQAVPAIRDVINTFQGIFGNNNNANNANNNANTNNNNAAGTNAEADAPNPGATAVVSTADDQEDIADDNKADNAGKDDNVATTSVDVATTTVDIPPVATATADVATNTITVSAKGREQMQRVVDYAMQNHRGASNGQCFNAVWGYLTSSGYGNLANWSDLPNMGSAEAKDFSTYMNARQDNLDEAGLQRLDTAFNPPITNPHDPRIPEGAVIVVAAGSTGTAHPTAGDIVIKGNGRFINDGPNMDYGTRETWQGKLLGVYIPK